MDQNDAAAKAPVRVPDPGPAPLIDPPPGLEPDPEPNPDPTPDAPDPEPDRDPDPGPPAIREPEPSEPPKSEPPTNPDEEPVKVQRAREQGSDGSDAPTLVLTHPPVPAEKPARPAAAKTKRPEAEETSPFEVFVGRVYDGPLDLLLDLIRKQDIDIYDIPIARITAQFLAYVNQLKATDVDVAGEFIYTASLLIHIKSKMLLPREKTSLEELAEDPRRELVERLLEHERFKNAAQMLQQKQMLEAATWTNPGVREFREDANAEPEIAADTTDLVRIFRDIMERLRTRPIFSVQDDAVTVGQMIEFLSRRLTMEDRPVSLRRLLAHSKSERALVAMFLALLELVRLQAILLRQDRAFSEIFIKKSTEFDSVVTEGLAARDDWR
jgi:segregation and condensation protein A